MSELNFKHKYIEINKDAPTLLLLHGTGGNENDLIELSEMVTDKFNILSPRGNVNENGSNRFFKRLKEGVFDEEDIKIQSKELNKFLNEASENYKFDRNKVYAFGYSNGANMAAAMILLEENVFAGAVLLRPMLPLKTDTNIKVNSIPILILSGLSDPLMPKEQVDNLYLELKRIGADVHINWLSTGHNLIQEDAEKISEFLLSIK